jgi:protein required for attachment to host cells
MNSWKGKGKATEVLDETSETHKRRRASPTSSSPLASHKRRRIVADETLKLRPAKPVDKDERARSTVLDGKRNHAVTLDIRESHKESPSIRQSSSRRISKDSSQVQDTSFSRSIDKKLRTRLMGFQVDFEDIPIKAESSSPMMNMERCRTILLRTGRIRTLGDKVTKDGSIYILSD